ncbi:sulfur carrier protein ThiS [Methylocella sp. CPCC 101449]|jgi:sulfur carrier protein|uniref:sulfur carrier protein ThiS n=1 Tax=Methylocella sp. CPCC 101449 TaxID=2987531 RepID=UPI00288DAD8F|nr:sulfur carrier protein ThiS [Methylocella sp. CPCC 101449]MDT2020573.1 sulfur carrier protein ThiS [Methylocella sp. CPCC 101449]HEV2574479.1 sulfur carrier protein ThiS [Beijerinckiaceae bacterium]
MKLIVNGQERDSAAATLDALWREETAELDLPNTKGFAIALNGKVVRQPDWAKTSLSDDDRVEIIRAFAGG